MAYNARFKGGLTGGILSLFLILCLQEERGRIEKAGGFVGAGNRVNGVLAISRALGMLCALFSLNATRILLA